MADDSTPAAAPAAADAAEPPDTDQSRTGAGGRAAAPGTAGTSDTRNAAEGARDTEPPPNPFPNRIKVDDIDGGIEWLNTDGPISLKDLRGKIVLLDFWTYCCINCMHVLPDLKFLEQKYRRQLVVIGVHSAKFDTEKNSENIRQAILRYEIEHPVVNDARMIIWRKFGVRAWPTLVLIDPEGYYCGYVSGEGNRELLDRVIAKLIEYHRWKGTLDESPVRFALERRRTRPTPLRYPGKVTVDLRDGRVFVSDSNHNRIVIADRTGRLLDVVGSGRIGRRDGPFEEAEFHHPQGTALVGDVLYVADTENHLIRAVDLKTRTVRTVAGTGHQGRFGQRGGEAHSTPLNSPWDLVHVEGVLYIAMAGPHQIWSLRPATGRIDVFSGTGREDILDGARDACAHAQPSGITTDGKFLYVADSEGSAIRRVPLDDDDGPVKTVVGASNLPFGQSLFEFGDVDGVGGEARLQHPLGVVYHDGELLVADTYNHKVKRIDLESRRCRTWLGDGKPGRSLEPPQLFEPGGLAVAGTNVYIADTNNHRVCVADLATGRMREFVISGLQPPATTLPRDDDVESEAEDVTAVEPQTVRPGRELTFRFRIQLPEKQKINESGPLHVTLLSDSASAFPRELRGQRRKAALTDGAKAIEVTLPLAERPRATTVELKLVYGYCREGKGGVCRLAVRRFRIPVRFSDASAGSVLTLDGSPIMPKPRTSELDRPAPLRP
ncbi:MAG: hypothetical protein D6725_00240 [Planctomycetota bacterium]|nr:MAG: hypothetical protein D6725_00240 [Planctomycetota bacterium]